jgi:hypothetical protein
MIIITNVLDLDEVDGLLRELLHLFIQFEFCLYEPLVD